MGEYFNGLQQQQFINKHHHHHPRVYEGKERVIYIYIYIYMYDRMQTAKVYAFVKKVVKNVQNIENTYFLSEAYFRFISISGI